MRLTTRNKRIYAVWIIALLVLGAFSENIQKHSPLTAAAFTISDSVSPCDSFLISTAGKTLPVEQFVSEKNSCVQEIIVGIRQRTVKPILKSGKNDLIGTVTLSVLTLAAFGIWFSFFHEKRKSTLSNIVIMDYIHLQDGQKP